MDYNLKKKKVNRYIDSWVNRYNSKQTNIQRNKWIVIANVFISISYVSLESMQLKDLGTYNEW